MYDIQYIILPDVMQEKNAHTAKILLFAQIRKSSRRDISRFIGDGTGNSSRSAQGSRQVLSFFLHFA